VAEVKYDNGQQDDDQDIVKQKWVHFFSDIAENREGFVKVAFSLSYKLPPKIYGFYLIGYYQLITEVKEIILQ